MACKRKKLQDLSKPTQKKRCQLDENKISKSDEYSAVGAISTGLKTKSILKTEKPKCSGLSHKKVHFDKDTTSGNANSLTVFDRQQALATVKKLWNMKETSNYIIARVSSYNVTDEDFKSLSSKNWLTDQITLGSRCLYSLPSTSRYRKGKQDNDVPIPNNDGNCGWLIYH